MLVLSLTRLAEIVGVSATVLCVQKKRIITENFFLLSLSYPTAKRFVQAPIQNFGNYSYCRKLICTIPNKFEEQGVWCSEERSDFSFYRYSFASCTTL